MQQYPEHPVPQILAPAPEFEQHAYVHTKKDFQDIKLSDYKGKWVVLFFYPLDFTFVCPTEIVSFSDKAEAFRKRNCEVIGASVDSQFSHMEWCKKPRSEGGLGDMEIPLIADVNKSVAKAYGCLVPKEHITFRATYIIDDKGILRHVSINDTPVGRNVDEVFRLLKAFQHADKFGEVCPAKWDEGEKTMKPSHDAKETQDYWKNVHGK